MSLSIEQLLSINSLKLSGIINEMEKDKNQFDDYCKALFAFIESFPVQEAELKNLFRNGDYDSFSRLLSSVRDALERIQATDLAQSSLRLLDELKTQKYLIVEAHLTYFLAGISELSIDIQMALQKPEPASEEDMEVLVEKKIEVRVEDDQPRSILAVDDVSLTLNSLRLALKDTKYKLIGVKSGEEALRFIKDHTPDLFILDIEMPVMDGYELARRIRNSGQKAPIIFLTGNAKQEYLVKAIETGGVDFIVKPVNKDSVIERIKKHIG